MAVETKTQLRGETIDALQDLIQVNIDARDGFQDAADEIEDVTIAEMFRQMAQERANNVAELQRYVTGNGDQPQASGSIAAAAHRAWMDLKSALTGGDRHAILAEAERGEDHIKAKYEDFLKQHPGTAVNDVLMHQYAGIKAAHDRVRDLRDATKE